MELKVDILGLESRNGLYQFQKCKEVWQLGFEAAVKVRSRQTMRIRDRGRSRMFLHTAFPETSFRHEFTMKDVEEAKRDTAATSRLHKEMPK